MCTILAVSVSPPIRLLPVSENAHNPLTPWYLLIKAYGCMPTLSIAVFYDVRPSMAQQNFLSSSFSGKKSQFWHNSGAVAAIAQPTKFKAEMVSNKNSR